MSHTTIGATEDPLTLAYRELHRLARAYMGRQAERHTLQTTALVHEAWLRLGARDEGPFRDRAHFFRTAAMAMRQVLVDHARRRTTRKRDADRAARPLDEIVACHEENAADLLALDEALERLAADDEELGRLVELRFFAGLSIPETARVLGCSMQRVQRRWRVARLRLHDELEQRG